MNKYQRVVESLLHQGTQTRYYYELILSGIRVILNEGWGVFHEAKSLVSTEENSDKESSLPGRINSLPKRKNRAR